jgi:hypothetical protein
MQLTFVYFIPRVQDCNCAFCVYSHKGINEMGAKCGVNVLYVELAISRTIDSPASIVTHNSVYNTCSVSVCSKENTFNSPKKMSSILGYTLTGDLPGTNGNN